MFLEFSSGDGVGPMICGCVGGCSGIVAAVALVDSAGGGLYFLGSLVSGLYWVAALSRSEIFCRPPIL